MGSQKPQNHMYMLDQVVQSSLRFSINNLLFLTALFWKYSHHRTVYYIINILDYTFIQ